MMEVTLLLEDPVFLVLLLFLWFSGLGPVFMRPLVFWFSIFSGFSGLVPFHQKILVSFLLHRTLAFLFQKTMFFLRFSVPPLFLSFFWLGGGPRGGGTIYVYMG